MSLAEVSVESLRCIEGASLELHRGHNLIWGDNASGKTSLLEAIFFLGRGRSFRTRSSERVIRHGQDKLVVFGRTADVPPKSIGIQVSRVEGTVAKISGSYAPSLAELSRSFPVQVIEPGIHRLVEEGGHRRRRWMDWAVFHVEPNFFATWSAYTRTLKQRNASLRLSPELATAWDPELVRLGEAMSESRRQFVELLQPYWLQTVNHLLGSSIELSYARGWAQGVALAEALVAARDRDVARGVTHVGPHRADVGIKVNGKPARDVLSRGQQKLVAVAMTLSQLQLIKTLTGTTPTLLLDDPAAELDSHKLGRFANEVEALNCQIIVTALNPNLDPLGKADRVFHVEQGRVATYNAAP